MSRYGPPIAALVAFAILLLVLIRMGNDGLDAWLLVFGGLIAAWSWIVQRDELNDLRAEAVESDTAGGGR